MNPGRYRVEFWDTWKGDVLATAMVDCLASDEKEGEGAKPDDSANAPVPLTFQTPLFESDIAVKVDRVADGAGGATEAEDARARTRLAASQEAVSP